MGGNVTALTHDGIQTRAEKIPVAEIGRSTFMKTIQVFLRTFNELFYKQYKTKIWKNEKEILNGFIFNGSTSFIMDPKIKDSEIVKVKQTAGDLDITVPEELKENIFNFLLKYENKNITDNVKYMGSNKPTLSSIGEQINAVFVINFDGLRCNCQVDFEFLPYENDRPTEWAKFSHSSSFTDAKEHIKAVHHKYLIRALVGGSSLRDDIVICTSKSTYDNVVLSKSKVNLNPRMLKFSVGRGIRYAYEPLFDEKGNIVKIDGKEVYKEIPSKNSDYITSVKDIFKVSFGNVEDKEVDKFYSFVGVVELIKKYLTKTQIENTYKRYVELLWGLKPQRAQELEVQNAKLDYEVKSSGYNYLISKLNLKPIPQKEIDMYYKDYGQRKLPESFKEFLFQEGLIESY